MRDQLVLFGLRRDDLEQRTVLIEQKVGIAVAQHTSAFRCQHEQLGPPVRDVECPHPVFTAVLWVARGSHLLFPLGIELSWLVLIPFGRQLIGGVVPDGGKGLDHRGLAGPGFGGRRLRCYGAGLLRHQ